MPLDPDSLWPRYAALWSADAATRARQMPQYLSADLRYSDPTQQIEGLAALDGYMAAFQDAMPGGTFRIDQVLHHHDRSLAHWQLVGPSGATVHHGISSARHDEDGRLREIAGFFLPP